MNIADTPFGARVARRLEQDLVLWLITVDSKGRPQPRPVWFLWQDGRILIYSRPGTHKLAHIRSHPAVSLTLTTDARGDEVVVISGRASLPGDQLPADQVPPFVEKYREGMGRLGMDPGQFAQEYSEAILVEPTGLRGH